MAVDLDDPAMEGYTPLQEVIDEDVDNTSSTIRDIPFGRKREELDCLVPTLTFASLAVDAVSPAQSTVFQNVGYDSVFVEGIVVVGNFAVTVPATLPTSDTPIEVKPGETLTTQVTFSPKFAGATTGGVYLELGNAAGDRFVKLLGTGSV